ncbi:MaoC family dehydratase [Pseudomonas idahonensis]|uniref:MaoC family dehydratase n=1 Tax=Pseudomonas idahonensis TaxID=2942628 RepID=UPI0030D3FE7E
MISTLQRLDNGEYLESPGMFFEDFKPGDVIRHWPGRTVLETDNTWLTLLSMNHHPLHFDQEYAKDTEFGKVLVNSVVTFAIINGMSVQTMSFRTLANLGWDQVRLSAPVFIGDTLYAKSKVLAIRPSRSRPGQGIATIETEGFKADGSVVLSYQRSFLVPRREPLALPVVEQEVP